MAKKIMVLMKCSSFPGKNQMSVIAFLKEFNSACDAFKIHEATAMWLRKHYLHGPVEATVRMRATITTTASFYHEDQLKLYSSMVQFFLKRYVPDDRIAKLVGEVSTPTKRSMRLAKRRKNCAQGH